MYKTENGFQPQKIVTSLVTETKKIAAYHPEGQYEHGYTF